MDEEAHRELLWLIDQIPSDTKRVIAEMPEGKVSILHFWPGMFIRNHRSGELKALFRWSHAQASGSLDELDEQSWRIILELRRALKSSAVDAQEERP
jgi:hypothetical protein